MRIALTVWNGRIAPVFDVAGTVRLVEEHGEIVTGDKTVSLPGGNGIIDRVDALLELNIDVLVCGAVSNPVYRMIAFSGVKIHSFISGEEDEVLEAILNGTLETRPFSMPGCDIRRSGPGCRRGTGRGSRGWGRNRGCFSDEKEV